MGTFVKSQVLTATQYRARTGGGTYTSAIFQADASPTATYFKGVVFNNSGSGSLILCVGPTNLSKDVDRTVRYNMTGTASIVKSIYDLGAGSVTTDIVNEEEVDANAGFTVFTFGYNAGHGILVPPGFYVFIDSTTSGGVNSWDFTQTKISQS